MARVTLTLAQMLPGGVELVPVAAETDGNAFANTGNQWLYVLNGSGGNVVVTIQTPKTVDGNAVAEVTKTLATMEDWLFGVFRVDVYNQPSGEVYVDYDIVTTVTVQAFTQ